MENSKVIELARELGKAIQEDSRYKAYMNAKIDNDNDKELQDKILAFNLIQQKFHAEMSKNPEESDKEKITSLNKEMRDSYTEIMSNVNMAYYSETKKEYDKLVSSVIGLVSLCCEGADPVTCDVPSENDCTGSCSGCAGC